MSDHDSPPEVQPCGRRRFLTQTALASAAAIASPVIAAGSPPSPVSALTPTPGRFTPHERGEIPLAQMSAAVSAGDLVNVRDFGAMGDGIANDRAAIAAADVWAQSVRGVVAFPAGSFVIASNLTIASPVSMLGGAMIEPADIATVTLKGSFEARDVRVFAGLGSVIFGAGSVVEARAAWWGFSSSASDMNNARWLQAAINSNASRVLLPNGDFSYSSGISIDRVMELAGCGSCGAGSNATGYPGASTTRLAYTGATGAAITLIGSGTEGKENIHLRDFSLWGNATCDGGIRIGSAIMISKSSIKNVHVRGFSKVGGYGVSFEKVLESLCENVYCQANFDGFVSKPDSTCTTCRLVNCHSRSNSRYGTYLAGTFSGCSSLGLLSEGNGSAGLHIDGSGVIGTDFISYYSEANNGTSGTAPIEIGKSGALGPQHVNFIGGYLADAVSGLSIDIDRGEMITFSDMTLTTYDAGFMRVTANSSSIVFRTAVASCPPAHVKGNAFGRARIESGAQSAQFGATIADAATVALPLSAGIILITDTTNNVSAMFSLNAALHTTTEWFDPAGKFSAVTGTPGSINVAFSSGYYIQNATGGTIAIVVAFLTTDYSQ